ncbi:MAG TPA: glycosyltransferase [Acidobacteriaceae bacterium]|jgi:glycosyltransferase involved in cell wall biosynthesis/peptidoglycan/xylan/chitin deacetylase (PgdA/CDA1 family)|nr:glycosyltransferase [Acidobacteriaceae bacterium]
MLIEAYYLVKPILPWRLRVALRQWRAERRRRASADEWPIDARSATVPPRWPGWPDGKRFALVLTHDVEGKKGYQRVPRLLELEQKYGFRASFNFVPMGDYRVMPGTLEMLERAGCEAGVHGLTHDGKLYSSPKKFAAKAARIRDVLRRWGAAGFRSPLMQHRLGWMHELGCEYDSSTFDVDPFEPQPDGVRTVFPFWVQSPGNKGFVELPYTLVQDFNLFKVLGEQSIDIWKKKLDWIVHQGGMALINTHPDYMCMDGSPERDEYPIARYEEFLSYARDNYGDQCWHALPREVSRHYCSKLPVASRNTRRRICMLAYSGYETDGRIRRYAETLAKRGDMVDVIALEGLNGAQKVSVLNGVTVYHIQRRDHNETGHWSYFSRLLRFLFRSSGVLTRLHKRNRYDVVHIHNMPDFLVFAAWYPKLTGARLILDIHDIVPELFANKFKSAIKYFYVTSLRLVEKLSARFVDHVIVSNHLWVEKLVARSVRPNRCSVVVNLPDPDIFARRPRARQDGRFIVIFPGTFQWHQGLDIGIRAFAEFKKKVPSAEFHLYGASDEKATNWLKDIAREVGQQDAVKFCGIASLESIADVIANADLGVVPKRADSFGNEAYSTKVMEFMSQGIPVVASRTKIDSYYFDENTVRFFPSGDSAAMAEAMVEVAQEASVRDSLVRHGLEYVELHGWNRNKQEYFDLIDGLSTQQFGQLDLKRDLTPVIER